MFWFFFFFTRKKHPEIQYVLTGTVHSTKKEQCARQCRLFVISPHLARDCGPDRHYQTQISRSATGSDSELHQHLIWLVPRNEQREQNIRRKKHQKAKLDSHLRKSSLYWGSCTGMDLYRGASSPVNTDAGIRKRASWKAELVLVERGDSTWVPAILFYRSPDGTFHHLQCDAKGAC